MCLINFHYNDHPKYKLIVVANRDEEYDRPTEAAHFWENEPNLLAGRDLKQMGTWLGVTKQGRFAALTNYRDPNLPVAPKSRGDIVKTFLTRNIAPSDYIEELKETRELFGGYNVIISDGGEIYHYNNILNETSKIQAGTHSLSNCSLNTPWPKVKKGKALLKNYVELHQEDDLNIDELFKLVSNRTKASIEELPDTGVGITLERELSPMFIQMPHYGTRSSTVLLISYDNHISFVERTFKNGLFEFDTKYEFQLEK